MSDKNKHLDVDLDFLDNNTTEESPVIKKSISKEDELKQSVDNESVGKDRARPWVRYWARFIDVILFASIFAIFSAFFMPSLLDGVTDSIFGIISLFLWVFAESALLSTWGTTPGKWLLRVELRTNKREKPLFSDALNRSFAVWIKGYGLGIPIVTLFTMSGSYDYLRKNGHTSWDEKGNFKISHKKIGFIRIAVVFTIIVVFLLLMVYGNEY